MASKGITRRRFGVLAAAASITAISSRSARALDVQCADYPASLVINSIPCKNALKLIGPTTTIGDLFDTVLKDSLNTWKLNLDSTDTDLMSAVTLMIHALDDLPVKLRHLYVTPPEHWPAKQGKPPLNVVFDHCSYLFSCPFVFATDRGAISKLFSTGFLHPDVKNQIIKSLFCEARTDTAKITLKAVEWIREAHHLNVFRMPIGNFPGKPANDECCDASAYPHTCKPGDPNDYCEIKNDQCTGASTICGT